MQRKLLELKRKLFMVMGIMLCFICFTGITVNAAEEELFRRSKHYLQPDYS